MVDPSVGYIFRARDTQQNLFEFHDRRFDKTLKAPKDWLENDPNNIKYIENRTHYILPERLELLKPTWVMEDEESGIAKINDTNAPTFITYKDSGNESLITKGYKMSNTYATEDEIDAGAMDVQFKTLLRKCYYYDNRAIVKISDKLDEVENILAADPNADTDFEISWIPLEERTDPEKLSYFITITLNRASSVAIDPEDRKPIKYIYFLAVKDAGYYAPDLYTTPYWGVKEEGGVRSWYRITNPSELETKTFDDSRPANPNEPPTSQYDINKYYLESRSFIAQFEEGLYGFCEFDYQTQTSINTNQAFIINSKERVVQLDHKYYQDIWDVVAQSASETDTRIGAVETRVTTLEGKVSTLETTTIPNINDAIADINSDISDLNSTKMNKVNPQGSGTMTFNGAAIFASGAYEGATATTNGKLITKAILDSAISTVTTTINNGLALKLNIANPAATGNFTLETDKVTMNGTTGDIVSAGTVTATEFYQGANSLTSLLATKRNTDNFEFDNGNTAAHFSGDLYVEGLTGDLSAKKVATIDLLDYSKCLGIYYDDVNLQYPTAQEGDYIYLIVDQVIDSQNLNNNKLVKMVSEGGRWYNRGTYDRIFTNDQWTNINTDYNSRVTALENQVQSLTTQVQDLTTLINELIPQAEGNWFGPSTFQPYINASNIAYPRD